MKLKAAIFVSVVIHVSIFALALYLPTVKSSRKGTVYYVDLVSMPGGGGGGKGGVKKTGADSQLVREPQRMKDLTAKKQKPQSKLRYPDENVKKSKKRKKPNSRKKKQLISVVKKDRTKTNDQKDLVSVARKSGDSANELKTGISADGGSGGGSGGGYGTGSGPGYGPGSGLGGFPYAYYVEALRGKISSSWYSALVSPGLRGRFVAVVYFKISRDGRIRDLELEEKSGINALDLSALRAIENAAPFPPLPNNYTYRYLGVHFEFVWEKK